MIQWIRDRPWISVALFLLLALSVGHRDHSLDAARRGLGYARDLRKVAYWISSSECTVKTGAILAYCLPDGKITGIENASLADDRGHTLLANLYALATGRAIDRHKPTAANLILNGAALVVVALVLFLRIAFAPLAGGRSTTRFLRF